jgi:hypothetical protein
MIEICHRSRIVTDKLVPMCDIRVIIGWMVSNDVAAGSTDSVDPSACGCA